MHKKFQTELIDVIKAGEPCIRVSSDEMENAVAAIADVAEDKGWEALFWDAAEGTHNLTGDLIAAESFRAFIAGALAKLRDITADDKTTRLFVVRNLHLVLLAAPEPTTSLVERFTDVAETKHAVLIAPLPPETKLPPELAGRFYIVRQPLPDTEEIEELVQRIAPGGDQMADADRHALALGANGLTRTQVIAACARTLVSGDRRTPCPTMVRDQKVAMVNSAGLVEILDPGDAEVGGNQGAVELLTAILARDAQAEDPKLRAKGALLFGPAGTGKSLMARALGRLSGRLVASVNPGRLMGEYVGNTERNTRQLFDLLDVLAPVVCLIDEIGKVMPQSSGGDRDSGVGSRMLGSFLTYMNDTKSRIFWLFAGNEDVLSLSPAFTRAGRVDLKFYVGLPGRADRAVIWKIHAGRYFASRTVERALAIFCDPAAAVESLPFNDEGLTGAEIETCCRLSRLLQLSIVRARELISPVVQTAADMIGSLQDYAEKIGALDAATGQLFAPVKADKARSRGGRRATLVS